MEITKGNKKYDFTIDVHKLSPPIGNSIFYYSKVAFLYIGDEKVRKKLDIEFGEHTGKTEEEAIKKMEKTVADWVEKQV